MLPINVRFYTTIGNVNKFSIRNFIPMPDEGSRSFRLPDFKIIGT